MISPKISVVIPALNAEARLDATLDALIAAAMSGLIKEVILVDGGSTDLTCDLAENFGATVLAAPPGRGGQLKVGADAARGDWLLFLHADTVLDDGWADEARAFMLDNPGKAAVFTLSFDAKGIAPALVAFGAMLRTKLLRAPYGDQGLLISRNLYDEIGGYEDMPLFEDVDIVRRLLRAKGSRSLRVLPAKAITAADRYERQGYFNRVVKNFILLMRYQFGASPEALAKAYK